MQEIAEVGRCLSRPQPSHRRLLLVNHVSGQRSVRLVVGMVVVGGVCVCG